jgi:chorismate mutase
MTELVMYFGIGFFIATLIGLVIFLCVHHRAPRLDGIDQLHTEVDQLEEQLAIALSERSKLQREIAAMKRDAETIWAAERVENALFRERINDVAYEVVRITQAIENSASSIGPTPTYAANRTQTLNITSGSGEPSAPVMHTGALADRIRALRTTASRVATN